MAKNLYFEGNFMKRMLSCIMIMCVLSFTGCQKTENQESEITKTKAIELSKIYLESINSQEFINLITNYDSPNVEKLNFDYSYTVFYFDNRDGEPQDNELKGKKIWKISYSIICTFGVLIQYISIYIQVKYMGLTYWCNFH